jgi:hypothetical protein
MTSDEIQQVLANLRELGKGNPAVGNILPLWEIAYQLAVMNERKSEKGVYAKGVADGQKALMMAQSLGSPVGEDSDKTVRDGGELSDFVPPVRIPFDQHSFAPVAGNQYCGHCGAGRLHLVHT